MIESPRHSDGVRGAALGLAAAALFGLSAPLAKLLLEDTRPVVLAGLFYLGGGLALSGWAGARRVLGGASRREAPLERRDLPTLAAIVLTGGVVGPVLMMTGLERVSGVAGALLLNLEAPLTILLALVLFGEHLAGREVLGAALVIGGAAALAWEPVGGAASLAGVVALAGACSAWALDNNLTQRLSLRDPLALVRAKALGAGLLVVLVARLAGEPMPGARVALVALVVGAACYGASIVLDAYALRLLGAAREAAYFATAPFVGAAIALPLLGERLRASDALAAAAMAAGVVAMLTARHSHLHRHEPEVHSHLHVHDAHHRHVHRPEDPAGEPHAHVHRHDALEHAHGHVSDAHHRHGHR